MENYKRKSLTVTVGIPAYNEERNIGHLLRAVLSQVERGFSLRQIIVVSDGSTDQTNRRVLQIVDPRIRLIANWMRQGQTQAHNQIFRAARSDVVVLFEADIRPRDRWHIAKLIAPMLVDPTVGLVQGNLRPVEANSFFGQVMKLQGDIFRRVSFRHGYGDWFCSGRSGRAFSRAAYQKLVWPANIPEDAYALLWCKSRGVRTVFRSDAYCYYRVPENFKDLVRVRQKALAADQTLRQYFPPAQVHKFYQRPKWLQFLMSIQFLVFHPVAFLYYALIRIRLWRRMQAIAFTDFWPEVKTTKQLF